MEPSAGADRFTLAVLCEAYAEEEVAGETRTVMRFHPRLAPIKAAVFRPLPNGGRGVMAMKLHEGEPMVGLRPVTESLSIATVRGDKRGTFEVKPKDLAHYRGSRARTGRALAGSFKRVEGFEG